MFDQLLNLFGQSPQGQQAYSALQAQGYSPTQSAGILTTAFPAAVSAMQSAMQSNNGQLGLLDIKNSNYAMNFLTGAVSGLVRGEGMKGAAIDGLQGVVGGHVAQVIATRCGLPERVAGVLGAIVTPLMIDFLWDKIQGMNLGQGAGAGGLAGALGSAASALGLGGAQAPAAMPAQAPAGFGAQFTPFGGR
jgi:hypothetical protein